MFFRSNHPAFNGEFNLLETPSHILHIKWKNNDDKTELFIDFKTMEMDIRFSENGQMLQLFASHLSLTQSKV